MNPYPLWCEPSQRGAFIGTPLWLTRLRTVRERNSARAARQSPAPVCCPA
jgi:hypothetical protein